MTNEIIDEILDDFLLMIEKGDMNKFYKVYSGLPFTIYKKIEKMAITKSTKNNELFDKAKIISRAFHKKFK